ncbi:serine hydrolase domain-containing protein [Nocardia brasiliensis]|uniref:serine hydrolase domain-containing protein n=1 Tax=Nocardia brasiliensis TaxID=37326 RepID=UPI002456AC04|nr:serine hydrolase [Nocardia brasiliensis]
MKTPRTWARTLGAVLVAAAALYAAPAAVAQPAERTPTGEPGCAEPAAGQFFERREPAAAGMDPAAVHDALEFATRAGGYAVQIYRHGCLIGDRTPTGNMPLPLASATKGVAALVVGRAITMGYFGVDDPLGIFFPQADPAHAALTVRQVLNQNTGLHFSWPADIAGLYTDAAAQSLALPFEHEPGTTFQYAQNVIALLVRIVETTTGSDFQDFAQRELLGPLGIDRANWVWLRDRSGNTAINGGLAMRPNDLGRLGRLLVQDGRWREQQLLDPGYLRQARTPSSTNAGYGFLLWLNAGDTYRGTEVPTANTYDHPIFPGSPRDLYTLEGALGQFVTVVPSRDLVIVRLGVPTRLDLSNPVALLTGSGNPDNKEVFRRVTTAVDDIADEPYDDPYRYPNQPLHLRGFDDLTKLADPVTAATILLGVGPYAATGCNVLWCNGKPVPVDVFRLVLDVGGQVAAAIGGLGNTPR